MPHHDKLNDPFPTRLGVYLPGFCLSLLVMLSSAWTVMAQEQAPVDGASELAGLDIATELSSLVPAAQVNALNWLRFGGDPDTVIDEDGNTVMHYAAAHPYLDILQEAVRRGGHCNRYNAYGATPLHFAASKGTEYQAAAAEAVRILARCEAAPDMRRACAEDGQAEDLCRADPDAQDRRGNTPLHTLYAGLESVRALAGSGEAATPTLLVLLAVDADPNVRNYAGDTPLMLAIRYKGVMFTKPEHVSELLRRDADPDTRNKRGDTPLIETVSLDTNAIDAEDDPVRIITSLLKHGADPDLRAGVGAGNSDTPLIRAARHEDDSVHEIEALLAGGADPCLRDRGGRLAYDHAAEGSAGQQALYDAGGYPDADTGLCVRDLRKAEEREQQLSLDQDTRQQIQSCLKMAGFDPGTEDGQFTPGTRAAVRAWQRAQGKEGIEAAGYFAEGEADMLLEACRDAGPERTVLKGDVDEKCDTSPDLYLDENLTAHRFSSTYSIDPNRIFASWDGELDYREITDGLFQACLYRSKSWAQESLPTARKNVNNLGVEGSEDWQDELDRWRKTVEILEAVERGEGVIVKLSGDTINGGQLSQCREYYARGSNPDTHGCECFSDWESVVDWLDEMLISHGYATDNIGMGCTQH